jgi:hypothetical protein
MFIHFDITIDNNINSFIDNNKNIHFKNILQDFFKFTKSITNVLLMYYYLHCSKLIQILISIRIFATLFQLFLNPIFMLTILIVNLAIFQFSITIQSSSTLATNNNIV